MKNIAMLATSVVCVATLSVHGAYTITASRDYVDKKVYTLQTNLEERIENAQPGNYSVVSNKAMNALQSYTETDPVWTAEKGGYLPARAGNADIRYIDNEIHFENGANFATEYNYFNNGFFFGGAEAYRIFDLGLVANGNLVRWPTRPGQFALTNDIPAVPSWAMSETKPTYTATEVGAASTNDLASATNSLDIAIRREIASAQPADYATVSNRAMTALQSYTETDPVWTAEKSGYVPTSRTVAGKALSYDITLSASDVGAIPTTGGTMTGPLIVDTPQGSYCVVLGNSLQSARGDGVWWAQGEGSTLGAECGIYSSSLMGDLAFVSAGKEIHLQQRAGTLAFLSDIPTIPTTVSSFTNDVGYLTGYTETDPTVPTWAKAASKPTYTASEVGAYSEGAVDAILEDYLPLNYFRDGQTIPMYLGDGTFLCDFGANWLGILNDDVQRNSDNIAAISAGIPSTVSNVVTTALVRERLGVYLYVGEDGGVYVHTPTNEEEEQ